MKDFGAMALEFAEQLDRDLKLVESGRHATFCGKSQAGDDICSCGVTEKKIENRLLKQLLKEVPQ